MSVKFEARLLCGRLHKNRKDFHELRAVIVLMGGRDARDDSRLFTD